MNKNIFETMTGALVIAVAAWFLFVFLSKTDVIHNPNNQYILYAKFENVDGIESGTPVMIGGVKIGVVGDKYLDAKTYQAKVKFYIDQNVKIPLDSGAAIVSSGLLGQKFVSITPGGDEAMLNAEAEIKYTQSSVNLESLLGKLIFTKTDNNQTN